MIREVWLHYWTSAVVGIFSSQTWVCLFLNWIWAPGNEKRVRSSLLCILHRKPYYRYQSKSPSFTMLWTSVFALVLAIVRAVKTDIPKGQCCNVAQYTSRHNSWVHTPCLIFVLNCHPCVPGLCTFMSFSFYMCQCHQGLKNESLSLTEALRVRHETGCLHVLTWPAVCFIVGFCLSGKCPVRKNDLQVQWVGFRGLHWQKWNIIWLACFPMYIITWK